MSQKIQRRTVLKSAIATSGTFGIVSTLPRISNTEDTIKLTTVKRGTEPIEQKEVSKRWYDSVVKARTVQYDLFEIHEQKTWFTATSRDPSLRGHNGINGPNVTVYTPDIGEAKENIPNEIDGIPILFEKSVSREEDGSSCWNPTQCETDDYDCVPGGSVVYGEDPSGDHGPATTSTCPVEYKGKTHLMNVLHTFESSECYPSSVVGQPLYQGNSCQKVGNVEFADNGLDYVLVEQSSDSDIDGFSDTIVGEFSSISGYVTQDGVDDMANNNETAYKYSYNFCKQQGPVLHVRLESRCWRNREWPIFDIDREGGCSGSPYYKYVTLGGTQYIAMIAMHARRWEDDVGYGPACYEMIDTNSDLSFGNSPTC